MPLMTLTREFHIPKAAQLYFHDAAKGIAVYFYTSKDMPCAIGFHGRAQKPDFRFRFNDEDKRDQYITAYLRDLAAAAARRDERAAQRAAFVPNLKAGNILYTNWGWEQTNVEFYQVIEAKGKMVTIRQIESALEQSGFMSGKVLPRPDTFCGDALKRRVGITNSVRINGHITAWLHDGAPKTCSWYA